MTRLVCAPRQEQIRWYHCVGMRVPQRGRFLLSFAGLGLGFMLIEMAVMQRFTLLLGQPVYTLAVGLAGLLVCTGTGSRRPGAVGLGCQWLLLRHRYGGGSAAGHGVWMHGGADAGGPVLWDRTRGDAAACDTAAGGGVTRTTVSTYTRRLTLAEVLEHLQEYGVLHHHGPPTRGDDPRWPSSSEHVHDIRGTGGIGKQDVLQRICPDATAHGYREDVDHLFGMRPQEMGAEDVLAPFFD
jgi:hypothetical protein